MNYFVTAIGTDSGKTVISAALSMALNADYWKPIQAGFPKDSDTVKELTNNQIVIHPESYVLNTPASPHYAAEVDGLEVQSSKFVVPITQNNLIIEGAGGCLVPLNKNEFVIDLAKQFKTEIILISNNYLGSINHTMLTLQFLKQNELKLKGIIFNGPPNQSTEDIIMSHTNAPCIYKVGQLDSVDVISIKNLSEKLKQSLNELDRKR